MKVSTKKWERGSPQHNAWLAYVTGAMNYTSKADEIADLPYLTQEAEFYVSNLPWGKDDE